MNKTTMSFLKDISKTPGLSNELLDNLITQKQKSVIFDLFDVRYDFKNSTVKIEYFVVDKEFPDEIFSFDEFITLLNTHRY